MRTTDKKTAVPPSGGKYVYSQTGVAAKRNMTQKDKIIGKSLKVDIKPITKMYMNCKVIFFF